MKPRRKGHPSSRGSRRYSVAAAATETRFGVPPAAAPACALLSCHRFFPSLPLLSLFCAESSDLCQPQPIRTKRNPLCLIQTGIP